MKKSFGEHLFLFINNLLLILLCILCIMPLLYIVSSSLSSGAAIDAGKVFFWPVGFTTAAYEVLLNTSDLLRYFSNSVLVTLVGTILSLSTTILCAYPLSKKYLIGRNKIAFFCIFTMLFSGGMIPTFIVVKSLGLINTYWSLWLTGLVSPYNMIIMRSFFENIPEELDEAAKIDGCGEWRLLFQVYLPLSKAVLATLTLFYGVGYWNMYQKVMLYINETTRYTLPVFIQQMVFQLQQMSLDMNPDAAAIASTANIVSESVKSAGVVVLIVPMLLVYPFLQKYFVKGVTLGAVKG